MQSESADRAFAPSSGHAVTKPPGVAGASAATRRGLSRGRPGAWALTSADRSTIRPGRDRQSRAAWARASDSWAWEKVGKTAFVGSFPEKKSNPVSRF